jgi:hypothetical protein
VIVETGEAINNVRQRVNREPIVEVQDENHRPVAGVAIRFAITDNGGAGGSFQNGANFFETVTKANGRAVATGFRPNPVPGSFKIDVTASFRGQTITTAIAHTNAAVGAGASSAGAGASSAGSGAAAGGAAGAAAGVSAGAIVAGAGIAAGAGVAAGVAATGNNNNNSSSQAGSGTSTSSTGIGTPGSPVFGAPGQVVVRPHLAAAGAPPGAPSRPWLRGGGMPILDGLIAAAGVSAGLYLERRAGRRMELSPGEIRFPKIAAGDRANAVFLVYNRSNRAAAITAVEEPELAEIIPPGPLPLTVGPGQAAVFRVKFHPMAAGKIRERARFTIAGANGWSRTLSGYLSASVVAANYSH